MLDKDIKFCGAQIDLKTKCIDQLNKQMNELKKQADDYQELERYYKEEKKGVHAKMHELQKTIDKSKCELGQMRKHKRELKKQKAFLAYQHEMIDNRKGKK